MALTTGLVRYYNFNHHVRDNSGNGHHGTITGATYDSSGKVGGCYYFDGVNDYVSIPSTNIKFESVSDNFSINLWFKTDDTSLPQALFDLRDANNDGYGFFIINNGQVYFYMDSIDTISNSTYVNDTNWHMMTVVVDRTGLGEVRLYVDGVETDYSSQPDISSETMSITRTDAKIGVISYDINLYELKGYVDEVGVWNKALTSTEVSSLYNSGNGVTYDAGSDEFIESDQLEFNVIGAWKFDGDVLDSSNLYDGINVGTTDDTTTKKLGSASRSYDGVNDGVQLNTDMLNALTSFTVASWFYIDTTPSPVSTIWYKSTTSDTADDNFIWIQNDVGTSYVNNLRARLSTTGGASIAYGTTTITENAWHLVIGVFDGSNFKVYLDGSTTADITLTNTGNTGTSPSYHEFGRRWGGSSFQYFMDGWIDDSTIWGRALSESERTSIYNSGDGLAYPFTASTTTTYNSVFYGGNF